MRVRPVLAVLVLPLVLVACGDDDDDAAADLTASEAQAIVDDALLDVDDLGDGWELTETEPPSDDEETDEDDPFAECMDSDIGDRLEAEEIAESETRSFEKEGDLASSELEISSGAVEDGALFDEFHDALRSETFERCLIEAMEEEIAGDDTQGLEISFGDTVIDDTEVSDADVTHVHLPVDMSAEGLSATMRVDFVFVTRGQVGSFFFAFGFGESITDAQVETWTELVAERLAG